MKLEPGLGFALAPGFLADSNVTDLPSCIIDRKARCCLLSMPVDTSLLFGGEALSQFMSDRMSEFTSDRISEFMSDRTSHLSMSSRMSSSNVRICHGGDLSE